MDFITGLPKTQEGYSWIWVIVDRASKASQFIPIKVGYTVDKLAHVYITEILKLHGIPSSIASDKGFKFVAKFWDCLRKAMGTNIECSSASHSRADMHTEVVK